ncbi:hypothetical protein LEMLEM_LOCUS11144 [Lemmus lemmus]
MPHLQRLCDWILPGLAPRDPFLFVTLGKLLNLLVSPYLPLQENRDVTVCDN